MDIGSPGQALLIAIAHCSGSTFADSIVLVVGDRQSSRWPPNRSRPGFRRISTGANQIDQVAQAVHSAADELQQQMPKAAEFVHAAASRIEEGAGALRDRSLLDLMGTFNDLGRKEPLAMFGGAVLAGFAISRFLKSSADIKRGGSTS